ncbi:hypothetical protein ACFPL7_12745 [Dongia soli]|uniref:Uncharacterized protein n=1 Tax=Dongia soli TaxID=600628 RepID=A0ABU5EGN8_9PROT|nr:hypothetical protein [Dongia soli]MDY0885067.1 hypothetical protein [Dongia soli]
MPFIKRDPTGQIAALFREEVVEATEYLPPTHPEVQAFFGTMAGNSNETNGSSVAEFRPDMMQSDLAMIRVYEDLIDILISKHVVVLTDFPPAAQEKLMRRKRLRSSFSNLTEALEITDEDGII